MTQRKYFGTDGIRGRVGLGAIRPDFVLKLGWAVGRVIAAQGGRPKVLIGKDTRISGYLFESALEAGLVSAGVNAELIGPMPTPAIAYLTRTLRAQLGIVISASHNPYYDNGIKFFSAEGTKLPDEMELAIEAALEHEIEVVESAQLGRAYRIEDAVGRYIEFCKATVKNEVNLRGLKLIVDCAHGATYHIAPNVFRELGAEVIEVGVDPDGLNINSGCGATDLSMLQRLVKAEQADLGIAFDGDGDRVMMIDSQGEIVDGDELLFIIVCDRLRRRSVPGVIGTLMSNLGLELALQSQGVAFERTKVGDRHVMAALRERGWSLGGENSGHIVCLDKTTTGDGIISALQVLQAMFFTQKSLCELKAGMSKFPQTLINVPVSKSVNLSKEEGIQAAVKKIESGLADAGRVLLRASGTEPVVRVMVEGEDDKKVANLAKELALVVQKELG